MVIRGNGDVIVCENFQGADTITGNVNKDSIYEIYNMLRGPLGKTQYKPKFSGHDTFPFRYAWLPKLVNYLEDGKAKIIKESEKERLQTITDFGVGLNMVKINKN